MTTLLNTLLTALSAIVMPLEEKEPVASFPVSIEVTVMQEDCFRESSFTYYVFL